MELKCLGTDCLIRYSCKRLLIEREYNHEPLLVSSYTPSEGCPHYKTKELDHVINFTQQRGGHLNEV